MDALDLQIIAAIEQNERDLNNMLTRPGMNTEEALHLLHEVQKVKMEFASMSPWSLRPMSPKKALRKKKKKSKARKAEKKKARRVNDITSSLLGLSIN